MVDFTRGEFEQLYLWDDFPAEADVETFVENERTGFARRETYDDPGLGERQ